MDFTKLDGLIPAVVQDATSGEVLMVGFMNERAWAITQETGYVTFFSRTRNTLWTKGETSGNRLEGAADVRRLRRGHGARQGRRAKATATSATPAQRSCFYTEAGSW